MLRIEFSDLPRIPLAESVKVPGQVRVPLVVGGIGTESEIPYMLSLLRQNTAAQKDQDHLGYILSNATAIPDRTEAIVAKRDGDPKPYEDIAQRIWQLGREGHEQGCAFMVTICNTIHTWREDSELGLKEALDALPMPWVSIMGAYAKDLRDQFPEGTKIAILATNGTLMAGLYDSSLRDVGLVPVAPPIESELQKGIMDAIYHKDFGIKAKGVTPEAIERLTAGANWAESLGIEVVTAGCTEIPLGLNPQTYHGPLTILNPLDSLAKVTLDLGFNESAQFPR